jgi:hypothetical protein
MATVDPNLLAAQDAAHAAWSSARAAWAQVWATWAAAAAGAGITFVAIAIPWRENSRLKRDRERAADLSFSHALEILERVYLGISSAGPSLIDLDQPINQAMIAKSTLEVVPLEHFAPPVVALRLNAATLIDAVVVHLSREEAKRQQANAQLLMSDLQALGATPTEMIAELKRLRGH